MHSFQIMHLLDLKMDPLSLLVQFNYYVKEMLRYFDAVFCMNEKQVCSWRGSFLYLKSK